MLLPPEMWFFVESVPGSKDRTAYPQLFFFLSPKQLTTPILQKMWSFVENVPGTAIFGSVVSRVFKYAIYLSLTV